MRLYALVIAVILSTLATVIAQTSSESPAPKERGFTVVAQIDRDLNTKHLKTGDGIRATVIQDVISHGKIIVPRDSKVTVRVIEVTAFTKSEPRARLAIVFEEVHLAHDSKNVPIHGVVQAIASPLPDPFLRV